MRTLTRTAVAVLLPALWCVAPRPADAARPFSLYQPIIDRCPFGDPPDDPSAPPDSVSKGRGGRDEAAAEADAKKEQEQLEKAVRVSAIAVMPDGKVMVGFSDLSDSKHPRHLYLAAGDERDGWLVKEADATGRRAVLVKDGKYEIERGLGADANGPARLAGSNAKDSKAAAAASTKPRPPALMGRNSLRGERRKFEEAQRLAREEAEEDRRRKAEEEREMREAEHARREAEREEMRASLDDLRKSIEQNRLEARRFQEMERNAGGGGENQD